MRHVGGKVRDEIIQIGTRAHLGVGVNALAQEFEKLTHKVLSWRRLVRQIRGRGQESSTNQSIVTQAFRCIFFEVEQLTVVDYSSSHELFEPRKQD